MGERQGGGQRRSSSVVINMSKSVSTKELKDSGVVASSSSLPSSQRVMRLSLAQDTGVIPEAQLRAKLRLKEYPDRKVSLKRLWIDPGKGGICKVCSSSYHRRRPGGYRETPDPGGWPGGLTRRQLIDLMTRELTPEDYELLLQLDEGVKKHATLSPELVERLPTVTGSRLKGEACGVCLVDFSEDEKVKAIPTCGHLYHEACISHWLTTCKNTCALCGKELTENDLST